MRSYGIYYLKTVPFIRLLVPFVTGILISYYVALPYLSIILLTGLGISLLCLFSFLSAGLRYRFRWAKGLALACLLFSAGACLCYFQDLKHDQEWVGYHTGKKNTVLVTLEESPIEKPNSYKALARVELMLINQEWRRVKGNILLYFQKDSSIQSLAYGSRLVIQQEWQPITNSGNPGGFDYRRYCAFQHIYFQTYLQKKDFQITGFKLANPLTNLLTNMRNWVIALLKKNITGSKESGVAEALLIGYRDDLDKELVQSYSRTGVVHIIAISGLHLGMIYGLLLAILKPFQKIKWVRWIKPLLIISVLWGFSLLAGAAASVLRSAVMFSFIVVGENMGRKANVLNTLAASAFCLLWYDPYFLWDVGFQLSYAAVLSIVLFMSHINRLIYFRNKLLKNIWQLSSITLSAQILTLPVILYHFHQFPNLFLFTNFIAVPLSGFILYGELALLAIGWWPQAGLFTGIVISLLISLMNQVIERTDRLPFAVTENILLSLSEMVLVYGVLIFLAIWLLHKKPTALIKALSLGLVTCCLICRDHIKRLQQHQLVVYNIPKHQSFDLFEGEYYTYLGDSIVNQPGQLFRYNLQPSRQVHGAKTFGSLQSTLINGPLIASRKKTVLIIDPFLPIIPSSEKIPVDIIILSHNPDISMVKLNSVFACQWYVFDSSNSLWKIRYWKKDADSLHLRHYSTQEQGALEVDL